MIKPAAGKLIAYKDRTFDAEITIQVNGSAKDLTGHTVAAQIRKAKGQASFQAMTVAVDTPATGVVELSLTPAQTIAIDGGAYFYDVEITNDSTSVSYNYVEGRWTLYETVTRDES